MKRNKPDYLEDEYRVLKIDEFKDKLFYRIFLPSHKQYHYILYFNEQIGYLHRLGVINYIQRSCLLYNIMQYESEDFRDLNNAIDSLNYIIRVFRDGIRINERFLEEKEWVVLNLYSKVPMMIGAVRYNVYLNSCLRLLLEHDKISYEEMTQIEKMLSSEDNEDREMGCGILRNLFGNEITIFPSA